MYYFRLDQEGIPVVSGCCENLDDATNELAHYIAQYEKDGPITFVSIKWKKS